jgi:hypothetical protein
MVRRSISPICWQAGQTTCKKKHSARKAAPTVGQNIERQPPASVAFQNAIVRRAAVLLGRVTLVTFERLSLTSFQFDQVALPRAGGHSLHGVRSLTSGPILPPMRLRDDGAEGGCSQLL